MIHQDDSSQASPTRLSPPLSTSSLVSSVSDLSTPDPYIGSTRFKPNPNIKYVLVTGGLGFIASWFIRHLVFKYPSYHIVCIDSQSYCSSENNIRACLGYPNFTFVNADITDSKKLFSVIDYFDIDTIIHMAAESHVDNSFENALKFTTTNVIGTQNLLEAAKISIMMNALPTDDNSSDPGYIDIPFRKGKRPIYRFLHMSTDEVYGEAKDDLTETALLLPTNPYSASKAAGDMFVHAYHKSYKVPVVSVRCNNVYGPMQYPEKIIPKFIRLLQNGEPCTIHGSGENLRRYLYVSDAVDALDTVLHKGDIGKIYNAGTSFELSNIEIAKKLIPLLKNYTNLDNGSYNPINDTIDNDNKNSSNDVSDDKNHNTNMDSENFTKYLRFVRDRPFNDSCYAIDSSLIHNALDWQPFVGFDRGLEMTVKWYIEHSDEWWKPNPKK